MNLRKFMVIISRSHPLYEKLQDLNVRFYDIDKDEPFEEKGADYQKCDVIFDFTLLAKDKKYLFLKKLSLYYEVPIVSELSCYWGESVKQLYPDIHGSFSLAFQTEEKSFEYFSKNSETEKHMLELFEKLELEPVKVSSPGFGFTFPRVLSLIVNEAYYALEENVASKENIDQAMLYGVNYPQGPFAWGERIGLEKICMLLDELFYFTKDLRYRVCPGLRLEAMSENK